MKSFCVIHGLSLCVCVSFFPLPAAALSFPDKLSLPSSLLVPTLFCKCSSFPLILSVSLVCPTPTPPPTLQYSQLPLPTCSPPTPNPKKAMAHKLGSAPSQYFQREAANPRAQSHNLSSTSTGWVAPTILVNTVSFILWVSPLLFPMWLLLASFLLSVTSSLLPRLHISSVLASPET